MNIKKIKLDDIKRCYCVANLKYDGKNHVTFASENPNVICESFELDNLENKEVLWKEPGGCMSIIPIPHQEKQFLAVQEFYLKVAPSLSKIVWVYEENGEWIIKDLVYLPYVHRFDLYEYQNEIYLVAATIARYKKDKQDWSQPGQIYAAKLPHDLNESFELILLKDNLFRNHGYCKYIDKDGNTYGYFGSDSGIYELKINNSDVRKWEFNLILEGKIGEIAVCDIDNDDELEIMTIEEFHGNQIYIYKKQDGKYQRVYKYDNEIEFAHALVADTINDKNTFIAGVRRKDSELFMVQFNNNKFETTIIDKNVGPANISVIHDQCDVIASANHSANEASIYLIEKE